MTGLEGDNSRAQSNSATGQAASVKLLDAEALAVLAAARQGLCDLTRAQIVQALRVGPLAVSDLTRIIGRTRTVISQHLRILRNAGLVEARRQGRWLYYRLASARAVSVVQAALEAAIGPATSA
jgi:DNA-binding transcriptional ArsR family regulator